MKTVAVPVMALLLAVAARLRPSNGALASYSSGSCEPYPSAGGYCSQLLGGLDVYVYNGTTTAEVDARLQESFKPIERIMHPLASASCKTDYLAMLCRSNFPPCDETGVPQRSCRGFCEATMESCSNAHFPVFQTNQTRNLVDCDALIGDPATVQRAAYADFLANWTGKEAFPEGPTYEESALAFAGNSSNTTLVSCLGPVPAELLICEERACAEPNVFRQTPRIASADQTFANPEALDYCTDQATPVDCLTCDSACEQLCPYPTIYSASENTGIWVVAWLPGMLAAPFNMLILTVELRRVAHKRRRYKLDITDFYLAIAAGMSLLLFLMDSLPTLILRDDVRCAGHDTFSPSINVDGLPFCTFGMLRVHVVQAIVITLFFSLLKVLFALSAAVRLKAYRPSRALCAAAAVGIFALPLALAAATLVLQADQLYESNTFYRLSQGGPASGEFMHFSNNLRFQFSCGPKYATVWEELALVTLPMMAAACGCLAVSVRLLQIVVSMDSLISDGGGTTRGTSKDATKPSKGSGGGATGAGSRDEQHPTVDSKGRRYARTAALLARSMVRSSLISVLIVAINVVATFTFIPQALKLGKFMENWILCSLIGFDMDAFPKDFTGLLNDEVLYDPSLDAVLETCGDAKAMAPSAMSLYFLTASYSMVPLAVAGFFFLPAYNYARTHKMRVGWCRRPSSSSLGISNKSSGGGGVVSATEGASSDTANTDSHSFGGTASFRGAV